MFDHTIKSAIQGYTDELIDIRRTFHRLIMFATI